MIRRIPTSRGRSEPPCFGFGSTNTPWRTGTHHGIADNKGWHGEDGKVGERERKKEKEEKK